MRRVGNRIQIALAHFKRACKTRELLRFRQRWAAKFEEFECVGGPLDGHVRHCLPHSVVVSIGGYYAIDWKDCRLHFKAKSNVFTSWEDV